MFDLLNLVGVAFNEGARVIREGTKIFGKESKEGMGRTTNETHNRSK